jgi:hypothetical protein
MRLLNCLALLLIVFAGACTSAPEGARKPLVAEAPSTPLSVALAQVLATTPSLLPSNTPIPTATPTANEATLVAQMVMTNEAGLLALTAMWELASASPTFTMMPSLTITPTQSPPPTETPTNAPAGVNEIRLTTLYVRALANLRTCPDTDCPRVAQVHEQDTVTANGTTNGESVNGGSNVWFRVDYRGQQAFVYSSLVSSAPPTSPPPPSTTPYPIYVPVDVPSYDYDDDDDYSGGYRWEPGIEYEGTGYVVRCRDGSISHSGGRRGACSGHGGVAR